MLGTHYPTPCYVDESGTNKRSKVYRHRSGELQVPEVLTPLPEWDDVGEDDLVDAVNSTAANTLYRPPGYHLAHVVCGAAYDRSKREHGECGEEL